MFLSPCFADQSSTYLLPDKTDISPSYSRSSSLIWESICGALDRISLFLQINYKRYFNGKSQSKSRKSKLPKEILCSVYRKQTCMKHNTDAKISFWLLFFFVVHHRFSYFPLWHESVAWFLYHFDRAGLGWNGQVNRFSFRWKSLYRITEWIDNFFILRKWTETTPKLVCIQCPRQWIFLIFHAYYLYSLQCGWSFILILGFKYGTFSFMVTIKTIIIEECDSSNFPPPPLWSMNITKSSEI